MGTFRCSVVMLALATTLMACGHPAPHLGAGQPSEHDGKIAYVSSRDGNSEIYVMNSDGTGQTRLTTNAAADFHPRWSPDGRKIAFTSTRDGNAEVYVMNMDGTGVKNLTNHPERDGEASWSPDGSKLAFSRFNDNEYRGGIYTMNADGSGQAAFHTQAYFTDDYRPTYAKAPAWSPRGDRIAFAVPRGCESYCPLANVYIIEVDPSASSRLLGVFFDREVMLSWSPDGSKLLVSGTSQATELDVASGAVLSQFPERYRVDAGASYSPDGTKIVSSLLSNPDSNSLHQIFVSNVDGSERTRLTALEEDSTDPDW